jgi:hypothetical protein
MNIKRRGPSQSARTWIGFLVLQVVLVSVALAASARRYSALEAERALPHMRNIPLVVTPLYDDPRVVTDEQLRDVLLHLRPRLRHERVNINHVDHALRFWGLDAEFDDPECLSGVEMRELLLDHNKFKENWGENAPPLLVRDENGIAVRTQQGLSSASHYDHSVAGLGEVGTPLDYPVRTPTSTGTVRDILERTLREFSLNQVEYEWSTLAFLLYLPEERRWISSENQEITFDRLANRIMRQQLNHGVCMGNHRLHTLVMMLRIDDQIPVISAETRIKILDHLRDATARFIASQHADGYWIRSWPSGRPPELPVGDPENSVQNRILATGHVLEWWALAPEEVHPPREVVIRAGQWLSRTIMELDEAQIGRSYTFLSHAGRALALWRGHFPVYFMDQYRAEKLKTDSEANAAKTDAPKTDAPETDAQETDASGTDTAGTDTADTDAAGADETTAKGSET